MKILLSALPRTGSKWLCKNLHLYLIERYKIVSELIINDQWNTRSPITDLFTVNGDKLFFDGHISKIGVNFEFKQVDVSYFNELHHRLRLLESSSSPMVIKIHPVIWHELLAIYSLQNNVNMHYTLRRRDQFDQCISIVTCRYTNIWTAYGDMAEQIKEFQKNPYQVPDDVFETQFQSLKNLTNWLDTLTNPQHLYYEDLIHIKTDEEFCNWLNLPYCKFQLNFDHGIEYGDTKKEIISNYKDLKNKFKIS